MNKKITCIVCPRGCEMDVEYNEKEVISLENNFCRRGEDYAKEEILSPKRVVTSTVKVIDGYLKVIPVKTKNPVKKQYIFDIMSKIYEVTVKAPVNIGDVIIENVDGEGTDLVATSITEKSEKTMNILSLKDKKCLVTGASRGIGKEIAKHLLDEGAIICLLASSENSFSEQKEQFKEKPVFYIYGNLMDVDFASSVPEKAFELMGGLDIVINNAGVAYAKDVDSSTVDDWDNIMNLNARAPFLICKNSVKFLQMSKIPSIINMSSVVGKKGYEKQSLYSASKHALEGFTKAFAKEVHKSNIRVHLICPGGVKTEMVVKTRPDLDTSVLIEASEIADLIIFLLTRRNNGVIENIDIRRDANIPFK